MPNGPGNKSSRYCPSMVKAVAMVRAPRGDQRHPLEAAHRFSMARPAREVRSLTDLLRPLEKGRYSGLLAVPQTRNDAVGEVERAVGVDDTVIRAHQHAAGARREPSNGAHSVADDVAAIMTRQIHPSR